MTKGLPDHFLHKNRLQEYAQKSGFDLPIYESSSEGFPHAPRFRASVRVNRITYTCQLTFTHRKEAEQNVAKIALQTIKQSTASATKDIDKQLTISPIYQDPKCCKSILNEFAFRMNKSSPKYRTMQQGKLHPVYVSSMVFDGEVYRGKVSGSKKDAEQSVARIAIESLLGTSPKGSDSGILLQIINSKGKVHNGNNTQRPVPVRPSSQAANVLGPSANANDDNKKRKVLQGESWHEKQMRIRRQ